MAKKFTDRTIKAAINAAKGKDKPHEITEGDGFSFRVQGGAYSFNLTKRYPGSKNPVRRLLGHYPAMTLEQAHEKAGKWVELIKSGIDPSHEEKRLADAAVMAEKRKQAATFRAAFEVYERRKLAKLRTGRTIANEMRRECAAWLDMPLADIDRRVVKALILAIADRGQETQAHQIFSHVRAFWNWVCENVDDYGIEDSPCLKLKPISLIGKRAKGTRHLNDAEIAALWRSAEIMGHPNGSLVKLLLLSGVRRNEAARMSWREVNLKDGTWIVPGLRNDGSGMKNGEPHLVTLVPEIRMLIDTLPPRGKGGDYVFSNCGGLLPIQGFTLIKQRLDALMKADLEAQGLEFEDFDLSRDVRRTVRTQLSKLRIASEVCEAILAHAKPGLHKVYNLHEFQDEKAEALQLWHAKLRTIVEPPPANVLPFRTTA